MRMSVVPYAFLVYGMCCSILAAACLAAGVRLLGQPARDLAPFLALAATPTIMGHTVFNWALRYVSASAVSVAALGEPVGATIPAAVFLDELPSMTTVAGGIVVLAGILLFAASSGPSGRAVRAV